jgi:hypothetical protein
MARLAEGRDRATSRRRRCRLVPARRLHGGVWASYLAGGVLGAFLALHWDLWSLTLLAVLAALIVVDVARRA